MKKDEPQQQVTNSRASSGDVLVRIFFTILGVLGQLYTIRDTVSLLWDLAAGTLDGRFWVSIVVISILFPVSLILIVKSVDAPEFFDAAVKVYAFALSIIASAYYFAISANYGALMKLLSKSSSFGDNSTLLAHSGLFSLFFLPLTAAVIFSQLAGRSACGVASVPLLGSFLYGCTLLAQLLRSSEFGANFMTNEAPRILMTMVLFWVGISMFFRFHNRSRE